MSSQDSFGLTFETLTGHSPFPWQTELYARFVAERIPETVSLPTGLGKTSVIAVWLLALIHRPDKLPRRLAYVVNRRTVVDQTTTEVTTLRNRLVNPVEHAAKPEHVSTLKRVANRLRELCVLSCDCPLGISTLRGQFADNEEWASDPSRPAIICGTVDMIGSRLLFNGYRIGFKKRPLHARFLGQDTLLVHDEAHLEPAFQNLIKKIEQEQEREKKRGASPTWPGLRVMALSATFRSVNANAQTEGDRPFELTDEEKQPPEVIPEPPTEPIHHVWRRLSANKELHLLPCDDEKKKLVDQVVERALEQHKESGDAVLVFLRSVEDALKVSGELEDALPKKVASLTGTMRGYERDELIENPTFKRFLPESSEDTTDGTVYLVCTSAGEVGVNLSADHIVCDLSTFDSMAQRFGRVNRFGNRRDTRVDVVHPESFDDQKPNP